MIKAVITMHVGQLIKIYWLGKLVSCTHKLLIGKTVKVLPDDRYIYYSTGIS